MLDLCIASDFF